MFLKAFAATAVVFAAALIPFAAPVAAATSFGGDHGLSVCSEAGCLYGPVGVAVDPTSGDVYVAEQFNYRVSKFSASGEFLFAFGEGVRDHASALQTCTVATGCVNGGNDSVPGAFDIPLAVAVDSAGHVYVTDFGYHRVEEFGPDGEFVLMFGGGVDRGPHHPGNLCTAAYLGEGDVCGPGTVGNAPGQIGEWGYEATNLAVGGPEGDVYVGDQGRVDVFRPSGTFKEQISLAGLSLTGRVGALAVDPSGDVFVQMGAPGDGRLSEPGAVPGVHEFEPNGTEKATVLDPGGWASTLAMNGSDLYVADPESGLLLGYHTSSGKHFQSFEPEIGPFFLGMGFSAAAHGLYISGEGNLVFMVPAPPPGPLLKVGSSLATPEPRGNATMQATIDPEGNPTSCRVEYVLAAHYEPSASNPYAAGTSIPCQPASLGEGFSNVHAVAHLESLLPGGSYHWRVVASSSEGTAASLDQEFTELPSALVDGPWTSEVSAADATVNARIDPLGVDTTYRLEYGTNTSYGTVVSSDVGAGEAYVPLSMPLKGLVPHTVYHYRLVTESKVGTVQTPNLTFTTQLTTAGLLLPDERAWEQVSPVEKHGADIVFEPGAEDVQAAADGGGVAYVANAPLTSTPKASNQLLTVVSTRSGDGWSAMEPTAGRTLPEGPIQPDQLTSGLEFPAYPFTPSLSRVVVEPNWIVKPLSPEATEPTIYIYDAASQTYLPVVTPADVETGSNFWSQGVTQMEFRGATPDLSHVVFVSPYALTNGSTQAGNLAECENTHSVCNPEENVYEWVGGRLYPVNVLPGSHTTKPRAFWVSSPFGGEVAA